MNHMDDDSRAEFELAVDNAWAAGSNDRDRTEAFIAEVRDAEQAHRDWAVMLLDSALRDGMWKRLKAYRKAIEPFSVSFANSEYNVPSVGGVARRNNSGRIEYQQLEFVDMTRDELLAKQKEYEDTAFAARRNKFLVGRLIEFMDQAPEAKTAREAAAALGKSIDLFLAVEDGAA